MIDIQIVPEEFQYDVQSMVQAFIWDIHLRLTVRFRITYRNFKSVFEENRINIILSDNEKKLLKNIMK